MIVLYRYIILFIIIIISLFIVRAKKEGQGGRDLHRVNEVNDAKQNQNSFPFVLFFRPNNVNNVNKRLKSITYSVNGVK